VGEKSREKARRDVENSFSQNGSDGGGGSAIGMAGRIVTLNGAAARWKPYKA
jgi:hypothetical protein